MVQDLFQKTVELFGGDEKIVWSHLYGFSLIGLKWPLDKEKPKKSAHRASFLLAAMAGTELIGTPEEEGPILKVEDENATANETLLATALPSFPILESWETSITEASEAPLVLTGLHGNEHKEALLRLLEELRKKGLELHYGALNLLLIAIYLKDIALWVEPTHKEIQEKVGELSANFIRSHHPKLRELGLSEGDMVDLENILNAYPAWPQEQASRQTRSVGSLLTLLCAIQWGKSRIPASACAVIKDFSNADRWRWGRHLLVETMKVGNDLKIQKRSNQIHLNIKVRLKADNDHFGGNLARELSGWLDHLLEKSELPELLEQQWKIKVTRESEQVIIKNNIRQHGVNLSGLLKSQFGSGKKRRGYEAQTWQIPGILNAHSPLSAKAPKIGSLIRLTREFLRQEMEDEGKAFLSGGHPRWSDIHNNIDAKRKSGDEVLLKLRKRYDDKKITISWLISAAGNGKSTTVMRVAYDLFQTVEVDVLWRPCSEEPEKPLDWQSFKNLKRTTVVVLDDANLIPNLFSIIRGIDRDHRRPAIHFILAWQGIDWNRGRPMNSLKGNFDQTSWFLDTLSEDEAYEVVNRLRKVKLLEKTEDRDSAIVKKLRERNRGNDFLTAMILTARGVNDFSIIIHELIEKIQDPKLLNAFSWIVAICRLTENGFLSQRLLAYMLGMENHSPEFREKILSPLFGELRPLAGARGSKRLRSRHRKIADIAYRYFAQEKGFSITEIYSKIVQSSLEVGRFGDWLGEVKVSTTICTKLNCRELRRVCYQILLDQDAPVVQLWQSWGKMESDEKHCSLAKLLFYKGIQVDEKNAQCWQGWALMEAKEGNIEKARELFEQGTNVNNKDAPLWQGWALMEAKEGNIEKARELFEQGTNADCKHAPSWQGWALMEEKLGNFEQATQYMEKAYSCASANDKNHPGYQNFFERQRRRKAGEVIENHEFDQNLSPDFEQNFSPDFEQRQKNFTRFKSTPVNATNRSTSMETTANKKAVPTEEKNSTNRSTSMETTANKKAVPTRETISDFTGKQARENTTPSALKPYLHLSNEELLEAIEEELEQITKHPSPKVSCHGESICAVGECLYR